MLEKQKPPALSNLLMRGIANELGMIAALAHNVEASLTGLPGRTELQGEVIEDLQNMDMLIQQVSELRGFTMRLQEIARVVDLADAADALAGIRLQAMQWRLADALGLPLEHCASTGSGRLELL